MSRRFYPRQKLSREGAVSPFGSHAYRFPLNERSREDGLKQDAIGSDAAFNVLTLGGNLAAGVNESDIVAGGKVLTFTITGGDTFDGAVLGGGFAAFKAGLAGSAQILAAIGAGNFALSQGNRVITLTLPAIAGYTIAANETLTWTVPASAFAIRNFASSALAAGVITDGA